MRFVALIALVGSSGCLSQIIPSYGGEGQAPGVVAMDPKPADNGDSPPAAETPAAPVEEGTPDGGAGTPDMVLVPLSVEAESATVTAPMSKVADANASGGQYLTLPVGGVGGKASIAVTVPTAGDYIVWGRVLAPTDTANSFHAAIDADTIDNDAVDNVSTIWDLPISAIWVWNKVNMRIAAGNTDLKVTLTAGAHTIYLNGREAGAQLDRVILTTDATFVPTN